MSRKLCLLILTFCVLALFNLRVQAIQPEIIPAGTILQCTLDEPNFSSKTAMVGDPLLCHLGSVITFGHSVFPRGAMLGGHLQEYKNPGHFIGKGWLELQFDRMLLPGGEVLPVSAKIISAPHLKVDKKGDIHGKGHPTRDAIEWTLPILWPMKVVTLPARGPYPALKGETRIALRLMEDVELPMPVARYSVPMPPRPTPSSYHYSIGTLSNSPRAVTQTPPAAVEHTAYTSREQEPAPSRLTIIALKDGSAFLVADYWVKGELMHFISSVGEDRLLPLGRIDLAETVRVNQERNVNFVLQSPNADGIQ